jgi:hypothetical protein
MKTFRVLVVLAALLGALLFGVMIGGTGPAPAQALSVTPVANLTYSPDRNYFEIYANKTVATDTHSIPVDISAQEWCDVEYAVTQEIDGADVNTTTVTIEYSNDKTNWIDGPALVSNNAATAADMTRVPVFGRFMQFEMDVTNTATPTWTINANCK